MISPVQVKILPLIGLDSVSSRLTSKLFPNLEISPFSSDLTIELALPFGEPIIGEVGREGNPDIPTEEVLNVFEGLIRRSYIDFTF